jgi:hypothetical protein
MAEEDGKRPENGGFKGSRSGRRRVPPTIDLPASEVTPVTGPGAGGLADEPLDPASEVPLDAAVPPEPAAAEPTRAYDDTPPARDPAGNPKTATDRPTSPPQPESRGMGNNFAAAVLGALAAVILVYFAAAAGLLPSRDQRAAEALQRVNSLQQSIASLRASLPAPADLTPLSDRVAQLEAATAPLATVGEQLGALEGQLQALNAGGELAPRVEALAVDLANLRQEIATATAANPEGVLAIGGTVTELQTRLAAIEERLTAFDPARLDALAAEVGNLSQEVADLDQRLARVEEAPEVAEAARRTAEIMAVGVLRTAANRGEPFKAELDLIDALGVEHPGLATLAPLADAGVPTPATLREDFETNVMDAILAATEAVPPGANFIDRMVGGVRSLVSVRPAGPIEGTTPVAIVSRVRANLQSGELEAAAAEWDSLPESGKSVSAAWAERLKARIALDAAMNEIAASLAPAAPAPG